MPVARQLARTVAPDVIEQWCAYARRHRGMGPGALVEGVRSGTAPPSGPVRDSALADRAAYGWQIVDWLREHFPQWNREEGNRTHCAAIVAVIRLHHQHGKGRLTVREHGPEIRAAVKAWDQQHASTEQQEVAP